MPVCSVNLKIRTCLLRNAELRVMSLSSTFKLQIPQFQLFKWKCSTLLYLVTDQCLNQNNVNMKARHMHFLKFTFQIKTSTYTLIRFILVDAESFLLGLLPLSSFLSWSAAAEDTTTISWWRPVITSHDPISCKFWTCCGKDRSLTSDTKVPNSCSIRNISLYSNTSMFFIFIILTIRVVASMEKTSISNWEKF